MYTKEHQQLLNKYKKENKPTKEELLVKQVLQEIGIKYLTQKGFLSKAYTCYIADFYLPKPNRLIIEVDGSSHIGREFYDRKRDEFFLHERNIRTLRIKNEELVDMLKVKEKILSTLH